MMMRTLQGIDGEGISESENWNVLTCVKEMRIQAENVSSAFYLCGR
jgi:hypothetical protein